MSERMYTDPFQSTSDFTYGTLYNVLCTMLTSAAGAAATGTPPRENAEDLHKHSQ